MKKVKKKQTSRLTIVLMVVALFLVVVLASMILLLKNRTDAPDVDVANPTGAPQIAQTEYVTPASDPQTPSESGVPAVMPTEGSNVQQEQATNAPTEANKPEGTTPTEATKPAEQNKETTPPTEATKPVEQNKETTPPTEATKPAEQNKETTPPTEAAKPEPVTSVKTPYATLNFPKKWGDFLRIETKDGNPYTVTFFADLGSGKSQKLFAIKFGGNGDNPVGMLKVNGADLAVYVESVEFKPDSKWSDKEVNIVFSMQEAVNDILADLELVAPQQKPQEGGSSLPVDNGTDMAIDTPYGELYYPSRWKSYLSLKTEEKNGYSVSFYSNVSGHAAQCLFVVYFGSDRGIEIGTVKDDSGRNIRVSIDIISFEPDGSWSEADRNIVYAMQEDMNYLLTKLG